MLRKLKSQLMECFSCKPSHTFSFKQSHLEAMTNVKLTQSRRLLKIVQRSTGQTRGLGKPTVLSRQTLVRLKCQLGGEKPERVSSQPVFFCGARCLYLPHKSHKRNSLLKQPGLSVGTTSVLPRFQVPALPALDTVAACSDLNPPMNRRFVRPIRAPGVRGMLLLLHLQGQRPSAGTRGPRRSRGSFEAAWAAPLGFLMREGEKAAESCQPRQLRSHRVGSGSCARSAGPGGPSAPLSSAVTQRLQNRTRLNRGQGSPRRELLRSRGRGAARCRHTAVGKACCVARPAPGSGPHRLGARRGQGPASPTPAIPESFRRAPPGPRPRLRGAAAAARRGAAPADRPCPLQLGWSRLPAPAPRSRRPSVRPRAAHPPRARPAAAETHRARQGEREGSGRAGLKAPGPGSASPTPGRRGAGHDPRPPRPAPRASRPARS